MNQRVCKFFAQNGQCKKGANCEFSHDPSAGGGTGGGTGGQRSGGGGRSGVDGDRWDKNSDAQQFNPQAKRQRFDNQSYGQRGTDQNQQQGSGQGGRPPRRDFQQGNNRFDRFGGGGNQQQQSSFRPPQQQQPMSQFPQQQQRPWQQQQNPQQQQPFQQQQQPFQQQQQQQPYQQQSQQQPFNKHQQFGQNNRPHQLKRNDLIGIQQMQIDGFVGFLPPLVTSLFTMLGIIRVNSVQFWRVQFSTGILFDPLNKLELMQPQEYEIRNGWLQSYTSDFVLFISFKTNPQSATQSLMMYLQLLSNQEQKQTILDVCNGEICACQLDVARHELCLIGADAIIRVFAFDGQQNKFVLKQNYKVEQAIESALQQFIKILFYASLEKLNIFLVGGKNGLLFLFQEGVQMTAVPNVIGGSIVDMVVDEANRRFILMVWFNGGEFESGIYIMNENLGIEGPVYQFKRKMTKIACGSSLSGENVLICGNIFGSIEYLVESITTDQMESENRKFLRGNQYPPYEKDSNLLDYFISLFLQDPVKLKLPVVKDILSFELANENMVIHKYILVGKVYDPNIPNIEAYEFIN